MQTIKKVVIIGPESTGKSTLCELLSAHYKSPWVPEFAREYLLAHGKEYTYDSLLTIAKGQLGLEEKICAETSITSFSSQSPFPNMPIFIDTDMYVMKVWCEFVFGKCHQWVIDQIAIRKYDLYLLCNADLPWVKDELREYPDLETREKLFHIYKDILVNQSTPWVEIKGNPEERFQIALDAVGRLIS